MSARLLIALVAVMAGIARLRPVNDPDLFWHLQHAELAIEARSWAYADHLSFTLPGKVFLHHAWISDVILLGFHRAAGIGGVIVFSAICAALSTYLTGLLALRASGGRAWLAAGVTSVAAAAASWRFEPRSQCVALVLLPAVMLLAESYALAERRARAIQLGVALAAIQLFWAHAHPSFVLMPLHVGLMLLGAVPSRGLAHAVWRSVILVALIPLLFLSPNGAGVVGLISEHALGDATSHIQEMRPMELAWFVPSKLNSILWLEVVLGVCAVRALLSRRVRLDDLGRTAAGFALLMTHHRFRAELAIMSVPFAARARPGEPAPSWERAVALAAVVLAIPLNLWSAMKEHPRRGFGLGLSRDDFPVDATAVLAAASVEGKVFNLYDDGAYLAYRLAPRVKIAIDGRTPTFFDDELYFLLRRGFSERVTWSLIESRYAPDLALIPQEAPLCRTLAEDRRWRAVYVDRTRALFAKEGTAPGLPAMGAIAACAPLSSLDAACARGPAAREPMGAEAARLVALAPEAPFAVAMRARLEIGCPGGDAKRGAEMLEPALEGGAKEPLLWSLSAQAFAELGAPEVAWSRADTAVDLGAGMSTRILRARLALAANDPARARADLDAITTELDDLTPPDVRLDHARALAATGARARALQQARRAAWTGGGAAAEALVRELEAER